MRKDIAARRFLLVVTSLSVVLIGLTGCQSLKNTFKPTTIERITYKPEAKSEWKDQTIFIDFDVRKNAWRGATASSLSTNIRDQLIEGVVEDKIFHVQDQNTGARYLYRIWIEIADPVISVSSNGVIEGISATFRIKSYDEKGNLVTAKTRVEQYKSPAFTVSINDSQRKLLDDFAHNAAEGIKQTMYEGLK